MSDILSLLFCFAGRIPRSRFWIGFVVTGVVTVLGSLLLNPAVLNGDFDHVTVPDTLWQLLMVTPLAALSVKRFNDRDWPWWFGYVPNILIAIFIGANHFGYLVDPSRFGSIENAFFWTALAVVLLAFADNAFLKGTHGPNRYGPDPLDQTIS